MKIADDDSDRRPFSTLLISRVSWSPIFLARHSFHFFPQNNKDAEAYWIQAANDGDGSVTAMVDLGKYYFTNEHYKDAFYWYQCATGRGDAHSQACIGKNITRFWWPVVFWWNKRAQKSLALVQVTPKIPMILKVGFSRVIDRSDQKFITFLWVA